MWPLQAYSLSREESTSQPVAVGYLDQWLVSCGSFSACAQFRFPLLLLVQGQKCGGARVSQAGTSAEHTLLTGILAITSPWFMEQKGEPGYTSHWFLCFLFVTHFGEYFK